MSHLWVAIVKLLDGYVGGLLVVDALCGKHGLHCVTQRGEVVHPLHQPAVVRQRRNSKPVFGESAGFRVQV